MKAISEHIPAGVFLDSIDYTESRNTQGNIIVLRGRLDSDAAEGAVQDYSVALADEVTDKGRPLFSNVTPPDISERLGEQYWNIILQLKREGIEK